MDTRRLLHACVTLCACAHLTLGFPHLDTEHNPDTGSRRRRSLAGEHRETIQGFLRSLQTSSPKDVIFVLDRSDAVGSANFYVQEKELVRRLIRQYFAVRPTDFNVAIVTFGREATTVLNYTSLVVKCDLVGQWSFGLLVRVRCVVDA